METLWLAKLFFSHLVTDFFLQKKKWEDDRKNKKLRSWHLYIHAVITAAVAYLMIGWNYWVVALAILITHLAIDAWKTVRGDKTEVLVIGQVLHVSIIILCWWFSFYDISDFWLNIEDIKNNRGLWVMITAFAFLTWPSAWLIGLATKKWRTSLTNAVTLENAGKWIGIIERCIILVLVLQNQYEAIGLLIAAKGLIRFNETDKTEQKTEYLLIGTLISISLALITGLIVMHLTK